MSCAASAVQLPLVRVRTYDHVASVSAMGSTAALVRAGLGSGRGSPSVTLARGVSKPSPEGVTVSAGPQASGPGRETFGSDQSSASVTAAPHRAPCFSVDGEKCA